MKRNNLFYYLLFAAFLVGLNACTETLVDDNSAFTPVEEGVPGELKLTLGGTMSETHVVSRANWTEPTYDESQVRSLYVFIIQENTGQILSKQWFPEVTPDQTTGKVEVTLNAVSANGVRIFAIGNLKQANQWSNNEEMLQKCREAVTVNDLDNVVASLSLSDGNVDVSRQQAAFLTSGYFEATTDKEKANPACKQDATFSLKAQDDKLTIVSAGAQEVDGCIWMHRLDAKVNFRVKFGGAKEGSFRLTSWQVVNAPVKATLRWRATNLAENQFLSSALMEGNFIEYTDEGQEFSFYTMENRAQPKSLIEDTDYNKREKENKDTQTGKNVNYIYAPDEATYVILKGEYNNPNELLLDAQGQIVYDQAGNPVYVHRQAEVTYVVHLGYIGLENQEGRELANAKLNDYNVLRNTNYTYNITVQGVENIKVEAESDAERQPSAEGDVVDTYSFMEADAHYDVRFYELDLENLLPGIGGDNIYSYVVQTPFTPRTEVKLSEYSSRPQRLDDTWVQIAYNGDGGKIATSSDTYLKKTVPYSETRDEGQDNNPVYGMKAVELWSAYTFLIKVKNWVLELAQLKQDYPTGVVKEEPGGYKSFVYMVDGQYRKYPIVRSFSIFIDENFYRHHPTDGSTLDDYALWPEFCNKAPRQMHIVVDTKVSGDGESTYRKSSLSISQKSIQTFYSGSAGQSMPEMAFGLEHTDEWGLDYSMTGIENAPLGGHSANSVKYDNGWYNTVYSFRQKASSDATNWQYYEDYFLAEKARTSLAGGANADKAVEYRKVPLAAIARNRDTNRNGIIDDDEIKWYVPAINQINYAVLGAASLEDPLYQKQLETDQTQVGLALNYYVMYLSSTQTNSRIMELWSHEGYARGECGTSSPGTNKGQKYIRCVRNLGKQASYAQGNYKEGATSPVGNVTMNNQGNYELSLDYMQTVGMRDFISRGEIRQHAHRDPQNRYYKKFVIGKERLFINNQAQNWFRLNGIIQDKFNSTYTSSVCSSYSEREDGSDRGIWRVPNLSELVLITTLIPAPSNKDWYVGGGLWSRTKCSVSNGYTQYYMQFDVNKNIIYRSQDSVKGHIRCVHDVQ